MVRKKNKLTKQPSPVSLKACEERTGKNINNSSIISWLANSTKNNQFVYNSEIYEIDSDEESDDFECNLKELEKPLNSLL